MTSLSAHFEDEEKYGQGLGILFRSVKFSAQLTKITCKKF